MKWIIKLVGILVATVVIMVVAGFTMLNTKWLQNKLLSQTVTLLRDKLDTNVEVDSVSIDLLTWDAKIYGLRVDDRQQRRMLEMEFLQADVDLWPLLNGEINVSEAKLEGVRADLIKLPKGTESPDTVANFQFILDTFKSDKKKKKENTVDKTAEKKRKLELVMDKVVAERLAVKFNGDSVRLGKLNFSLSRDGEVKGKIENLYASWDKVNKKGENVTHEALITQLDLSEEDGVKLINLRRVNFKTNNHRPRKNAAKPKRGFFDVGHFNIWADMKLSVDYIEDGVVHGHLNEMTACDTITGIDIRKLQCEFTANKEGMRLEDVQIQQGDIHLQFVRGDMAFPNKKTGAKLKYFTSTISGTAVLKSISRPFAPVLKGFTLPLSLSVRMDGDENGMRFHDVKVTRPDNNLVIKAKGFITGLKNKYQLNVHFDVQSMTARNSEIIRIINQFTIRKFMMKQLKALGTIRYHGSFDVLWKKEKFRGTINTNAGDINFNLTLDELSKYLTGHAQADAIEIGKVMDMNKIGPVSAEADFKFDYSKPRTALMRRKIGGKLPIGHVKATVQKASYGAVSISDVLVEIVSNGAIAEGSLFTSGKFADLSCNFSFTNTDEMKKTKIKPHVKLNLFGLFGKSGSSIEKEALRKQKEEEKQRRLEERTAEERAEAEDEAVKRAAMIEAKAAKDLAKAQAKAERKAAKEAEKAEKARAKAERKAAKEAEKAAKRAAKEAEKQQ